MAPLCLRSLACAVLALALLTRGADASPAIAAHHKTACIACCACKHYTKVVGSGATLRRSASLAARRLRRLVAWDCVATHPRRCPRAPSSPPIAATDNAATAAFPPHSISFLRNNGTHTAAHRARTARTMTAATGRTNSAGTRTIRRRIGARRATAWWCRGTQGARRAAFTRLSDGIVASWHGAAGRTCRDGGGRRRDRTRPPH